MGHVSVWQACLNLFLLTAETEHRISMIFHGSFMRQILHRICFYHLCYCTSWYSQPCLFWFVHKKGNITKFCINCIRHLTNERIN